MEQAFNWIKGAIATSENEFHFEGCKKLLELFANKYKVETLFAGAYNELYNDLNEKIKQP